MKYSPDEWHWIPTLPGTECLPVVADIVRQWRRQQIEEPRECELQPVCQTARLLVISPHPDDAALSVGGLLHILAGSWQRHIGTLVGHSGYELHNTAEDSDVADVSARRKAEDQRFADIIGATLHYGTALDAPLRHPILSPYREPRGLQVSEFEIMIEALVQDIRPRLILAPLGIGGHADHIAARRAAGTVARRRSVDLLLYEDLPYVAQPQEVQCPGAVPLRSWSRWLLPIDRELLRKIACLGIYESQFDLASIQRTVANHAWDGHSWVERFWTMEGKPVESKTTSLLGLIRGDR